MSSIQENLAQNPKFLFDNQHDSHKSRVLTGNLNPPLRGTIVKVRSHPARTVEKGIQGDTDDDFEIFANEFRNHLPKES